MKNKTYFFSKLYCPRISLLSLNNFKRSKYSVTTQNLKKHSKMSFKKESVKIKETVYNFVHNTRKNQIKHEQRFVNRNKNEINQYISILNEANIDEGIVLNKYFAYIKNYNNEFTKSQKLKLKGNLIPIKTQERIIKNLKKNIKFFQSLSNNMLMKYMVENKEKFSQYLDEISSYKTKNTSQNYNQKKYSIDKNVSVSKSNDTKTILKTFSSNDENNRYQNHLLDNNNNYNNLNTVSNLKLKIGENLPIKNNIFMTPHSRNRNKENYNGNTNPNLFSHKESINVNKKYYTPFIKKKFIKNCLENYKGNEILSSRSDYKMENYKFPNASKKTKNKEFYKLTLE